MASKFRQAVQKAHSARSLSVVQIVATALAAITMAFISTRVTNAFNSIIAVGVISVLSALVAEFWRFTIRVGAESASIIAAETLEHKGDPNEDADADEDAEPAQDEAAHQNEDAAGRAPEEPVPEGSDKPKTPSSAKQFWAAAWASTPVRLAALFLLMGSLTVGVSYAVARSQGKSDTNITNVSPVQHLSEEERQEILDAAAIIAQQQAQDGDGDQGSSETPDGATGGDSAESPDKPADSEAIARLTELLEQQREQSEQLQQQLTDLQEQNASLQAQIDDLKAQLGLPPNTPEQNAPVE